MFNKDRFDSYTARSVKCSLKCIKVIFHGVLFKLVAIGPSTINEIVIV